MNDTNVLAALEYLSPADLSYQEWVNVGMGLKQSGYDVSVWDNWSRNDSRYRARECARKWDTFQGAGNPITAATIVQMALDAGFRPQHFSTQNEGHALDWADEIGGYDSTAAESSWHPARELITYLDTLFESSDNVGYVTGTWRNEDGKYLPKKGSYDRTAGQLIEQLADCDDDIGCVLGDYDPMAGAWIRFNPLDGKGVKNENVTEFRFALVESDCMPIEEQERIIRELELPVACLVSSGGKSIHAIVHIDAGNYDEYRRRVQFLYDICKQHGLEVDQQNKNPARLSRMPGVLRNGRRQRLLDTNLGKADWAEWKDYIEAVNDHLPDAENMGEVWDDLPPLAPPLIEGVLRQGHKMLLAGPSKAAKSFGLIELCISIAEGLYWMGFACAQGKVLYVNLELDRASCLHRFRDVYEALEVEPHNLRNIDVWNLRGKSVPMDSLAPKLIRRAKNKGYLAVVIDPIYKVITGDENSADQMAAFCNQFDKVCTELGCSVIYCHHHSKGAQGGKRSMDRASGSGVFARDPDALLDLIELPVSEELRTQAQNTMIGKVCGHWLRKYDLIDEVSPDDLCSEKAALEACKQVMHPSVYSELLFAVDDARAAAQAQSAWRIEGTLREFPKFPPVNIWFDYPVHRKDTSGVLGDIQPETEQPTWKRNFSKKKTPEQSKKNRKESIEKAFDLCCMDGGTVSLQELTEYLGVTEKTVRNRLKEHGGFWIEDGKTGRK